MKLGIYELGFLEYFLSQSLHLNLCSVYFVGMFLAIIWACLFPSIVRKYCFASEIESNEKSQLLKNNDEETTTELCEKIPGSLIITKIGLLLHNILF